MKRKKLLILIFVSLFVLLMDTSVFASEEFIKLDKGDVTGDCKYSVRDALRTMLQVSANDGASSEDIAKMDVDSDGNVTKQDAILIMDAALGKYRNFGYQKPKDKSIIVDCYSYRQGNYCFRSLNDAIVFINQNKPASDNDRITLYLAPGSHRTSTALTAPYISFEAMYPENEESAKVTSYYGTSYKYFSIDNGKTGAGGNNAALMLESSANDFKAKNIFFENSFNLYITEEERTDYCPYPYNDVLLSQRENDLSNGRFQTMAQALTIKADRCSFENCRIVSRQDTLYMINGRQFFKDCFIEGTDDFIYGGATAVFDNCQLNIPYGSGHVTAAATKENEKFGYLFKDCSITKEKTSQFGPANESSNDLGRPWNGVAMVVFWNCKIDNHIKTGVDRFANFATADRYTRETARYAEGNTMDIEGKPLDLSVICPDYEKIVTESEMTGDGEYAFGKWLLGNDGWNPGNY